MSVLDTSTTSPSHRPEEDGDEEPIDLRGDVAATDERPLHAHPVNGHSENGHADNEDSDNEDSDNEDSDNGRSRRARRRRSRHPVMKVVRPEGVRVRRVRIGSVAKVAVVFCAVGYLAVLGTVVAFWNAVQQLGFVSDVEDLAISSLGLETFTIDGQQLFELSAIVLGAAFALGFVILLLLALVYNATCALLGGVALEFGPLRRKKRVFSPKHRRYISV